MSSAYKAALFSVLAGVAPVWYSPLRNLADSTQYNNGFLNLGSDTNLGACTQKTLGTGALTNPTTPSILAEIPAGSPACTLFSPVTSGNGAWGVFPRLDTGSVNYWTRFNTGDGNALVFSFVISASQSVASGSNLGTIQFFGGDYLSKTRVTLELFGNAGQTASPAHGLWANSLRYQIGSSSSWTDGPNIDFDMTANGQVPSLWTPTGNPSQAVHVIMVVTGWDTSGNGYASKACCYVNGHYMGGPWDPNNTDGSQGNASLGVGNAILNNPSGSSTSTTTGTMPYNPLLGSWNNNSSTNASGQASGLVTISDFAIHDGLAIAEALGYSGTGAWGGTFVTQAMATALYNAAVNAGLLHNPMGRYRGVFSRTNGIDFAKRAVRKNF